MKALAIIALIIFGICMISFGVSIEYLGGKLRISVLVCGIERCLYPRGRKKDKQESKPEEKPAEENSPEKKPKKAFPKLEFNSDEILELIKRTLKGIGCFGRIKVNNFLFHILVGGKDPYYTSLKYGRLNTLLSVFGPLCSEAFIVRKCDVQTGVDFLEERTEFDTAVCVTIRLGQVLRMLFSILFGAGWVLVKNRIRVRRERRLNPPENSAENEIIINNDDTVSDERNENHGEH